MILLRQVGEMTEIPAGLFEKGLGENGPRGDSDQWALKTVWGVGYKFELAGAPGAKES